MRIAPWAQGLGLHPALSELSRLEGQISLSQIVPEARPFVLTPLLKGKNLLITSSYDRALQWQARLMLCGYPGSQIRILPSGQSSLFEDSAPETIALSDRIGALRFLLDQGEGIVITTPQAALERTLPREVLESAFVEVKVGTTLDEGKFILALQMLGYERAEPVRMPGQYSRRGGIIDVFPVGMTLPIRIELFGDDVESMRSFDAGTQKSIAPVLGMSLSPSRETLYALAEEGDTPEDLQRIRNEFCDMIRRSADQEGANLPDEAGERLQQLILEDTLALESGVFFDRLDLYRPLLHPDSNCAIDLLGEDGMLVLDEPLEIAAHIARAEEELSQALESRTKRGEILHSTVNDYMLAPERLGQQERLLSLSSMGGLPDWLTGLTEMDLAAVSMEPYRGRADSLAIHLKRWLDEEKCTVILSTDQPTRAKAVLSQIEVFPQEDADVAFDPGLFLAQGNLAGGFIFPDLKIVVLTDMELFGVGRLKLPQRKFNEGVPVATVLDLKPGDFVVHINFGVGVFQGLVQRDVAGIKKEFLFIQYAGPDKLYVPADQLDRIQKFLSPGEGDPKLNRLQGGEWQRAVGKAREEAREFARDLIKIYANRKKAQRQSYGEDSPWQAEMEATFPWMETPSQMSAINDVKRDLQNDYPMDRLVCGDVGFGKTEVAIRAAFKVAQSGKQVAVLCPTTILSEQHHRSFSERLGAFPTQLDYVNRFRTSAEKREIKDRLGRGEIDIIIGTHALLAEDLKFKELGLVIIDEEQKFGVKQKETLKALRSSVDVLSMSATPIPRTLNMALMDIRQMSLINDPPPGRLPIRTYVRPYSQEVVREAVLRELARGGQVYYVYNRVTGIYHLMEKLSRMFPTAKIAVGHGQMPETELEPVMLAFIKGEVDILLSTTIVESGLDIPNANTLIVENADRFGLGQLYQLRGRVGRSDRQAYAYLLYQNEKSLTDNAMSRLQSLQEFSSLGSGYSLAFRDLQIRGAGDLLGAKQSGTMQTIGYELFMQIIAEEVQFLKTHADGEGRSYVDPLEGLEALPSADLPVTAYIPEYYVPEQAQRLYYYKQLMSSRTLANLDEAITELLDRYGKAPAELQNVFSVMRLRLRMRDLHIEKAEANDMRIALWFTDMAETSPRVFQMLQRDNSQAHVSRDQYIWPYRGNPITALGDFLDCYSAVVRKLEEQRAALSN